MKSVSFKDDLDSFMDNQVLSGFQVQMPLIQESFYSIGPGTIQRAVKDQPRLRGEMSANTLDR